MIDKLKIQKAIDNKSCMDIGLWCCDCPVFGYVVGGMCGKKNETGFRDACIGLRPRSIRIMQQWLDKQGEMK